MSATGKQLHDDAVAAAPAMAAAMNDAQRLVMAKVGLNALIDEATGFQRVRPADALRTMAKELAPAIAAPPKRVQLSRRKGYRKPDGVVTVSRPTKWGNPFLPGAYGDAAAAVREFRRRLTAGDMGMTTSDVRHELRGKDLACWCQPDQPCHADVLLEIANS